MRTICFCCLFSYKSPNKERAKGDLNRKINIYLAFLASWLYKWGFVMNTNKRAYTIKKVYIIET